MVEARLSRPRVGGGAEGAPERFAIALAIQFMLVGVTFLCAAWVQSQRGHVGIEALAGYLQAVGIRTHIKTMERATFLSTGGLLAAITLPACVVLAGRSQRITRSPMPTRPAGESRMKPTNTRPKNNNQFSVYCDRYSRNSRKNSAPTKGPAKLRMPPISTIASSSPDSGTDSISAEAMRWLSTDKAPARPVTVAEMTNRPTTERDSARCVACGIAEAAQLTAAEASDAPDLVGIEINQGIALIAAVRATLRGLLFTTDTKNNDRF